MNEADNSAARTTRPEEKIKFSQMAAYGAGGIIPIALFNIAGIMVGLMGNISLGLSAFWLGLILIIPRLWDAISDPIIGHLSDNTRTRWGRRRPYLLIGGLLVALFFVVMWWIPKGEMAQTWFPTESGFQAFQLVYILIALLLFFTAVNIFEIPHGALGMELTTDYHYRTRLFSAKSFVGNLFAMSTPWLIKLARLEIFRGPGGNEADGMRYVSIMIAAFLIPLSFWWFFKLREPGFVKAAKHEKTPFWKDMKTVVTNRNFVMLTLTIFTLAMGFNFVQLLGSYIPIFYVFGGDKDAGATMLGINGTVWAITGVLAVFPLNVISPKLGKRNTLAISIILMCLAQLSKIVCYNPDYPYLIVIPTILLSAGMLFFFTLGSSMVGDICDEDELHRGYRSEGSFYSIFWWFIKMGTALASFVGGALIVLTMFDEIQVTKVDGLQGSIGELQNKVQYWKDYQGRAGITVEWIEKARVQCAEALEESRDYTRYLEKESLKEPDKTFEDITAYQRQRKDVLTNALTATKTTLAGLEKLQPRLNTLEMSDPDTLIHSLIKQTIPLTLQTKVEKARKNSFDLMSHLQAKSLKSRNSKEHYNTVMRDMTRINNRITNLNLAVSLDFLDKELSVTKEETSLLTKQTPYTLLMMRVVEIGLPVILSILSIIFLLRYSLTEKRSHEIKDLLEKRSAERLREENAAGNAIT
ncbi:MAG: MFS transporter [Lentimicrobiaceae bacterium]|nr:MFS transporter [Lentimicrobiaceae bacterium]